MRHLFLTSKDKRRSLEKLSWLGILAILFILIVDAYSTINMAAYNIL